VSWTAGEEARAAARRVAAWAARLRPRTILIAGWLVFLLYAYPGYMSSDSIDQLLDSRGGAFNDWHSPTMTELWRVVGFVIAGPFGMLALQSLALLVGAYALIARTVAARTAAVLASGLLVFPPVMATMAVIWQDSQMAGFLVAGLAAITSRRRSVQLCGLGLLVLASAMRVSAAFAVLPMLVGLALHADRMPRARWRRCAIALVAWAAVWLGAVGLDAGLRSTVTDHARLELATADLVGVLRYAGPIDDAELRELLAGVPLRGTALQARAQYAHPGRAATGPDRIFDPPTDADGRDAIVTAQRRLALAYPGAYLTHRWHTVYRVLGLGHMPAGDLVYTGFAGSSAQADAAIHVARHAAVQRAMIAVVAPVARSPLFSPYVYAVAAIVLLPLAVRRRQIVPAILLASGLGYELTLFVIAARAQPALSHWMITATSLAGVLMTAHAVCARRAHRASQAARA
jgi:hypothetical protein